jgi:hypothetical protein
VGESGGQAKPDFKTVLTSSDPLANPPDGMFIGVETLNVDPVNVGASPVAVKNWEYFDGSLLCAGMRPEGRLEV